LITVAMSKVIRSPRARVWRALVSPEELIRWDERRISLEEPVPDYPSPGRSARWRCWLGSVSVVHCEDALEVVPAERLRSAVRLASFEFEETYTLADQLPDATRLSLRLVAKNRYRCTAGARPLRRAATLRGTRRPDAGAAPALVRGAGARLTPFRCASASVTQRSGSAKRERSSGERSIAP
jgi:uncharacterized protein YndB with AHSA1/START domain